MAQSGPGAGVGGQTWLAAEKIKSHQVEYRGSRLCAQCAGANKRADEYDRWEAEVHAPDGVDAFAVGSSFPLPNYVLWLQAAIGEVRAVSRGEGCRVERRVRQNGEVLRPGHVVFAFRDKSDVTLLVFCSRCGALAAGRPVVLLRWRCASEEFREATPERGVNC